MGKKRSRSPLELIGVFLLGILCGAFSYHLLSLSPSPSPEGGFTPAMLERWLENARGASIPVLAVSSGREPVGVVCTLACRVQPGEGYIYVGVDPMLVGFDFQDSDRRAVEVAARLAGYPLDEDGVGLKGCDVFFLVAGPGEKIRVEAIDGPSAGAATALAVLASLENRRIREGYAITGTVEEGGRIGQVGGILYKAQAAAERGINHLLVPKGQGVITVYKEVVWEPFPGFRWITYRPELVDLNEYAKRKGWNLQVVEVSTVEEAASLMLE